MFAMELGKYQDIAQDIVMKAVKELAIERGVKELSETWKVMEFTVLRHFKGKTDGATKHWTLIKILFEKQIGISNRRATESSSILIITLISVCETKQTERLNLRVSSHMHSSGAEDRGFILGPLDELNAVLEDNMLNVHSMAASQFIGPFLGVVQKWEQTMHTIAEVLEVWVDLQRKWLYLEGIFVAGDIRLQLPEETKRFDDIDKSFKKIMADTAKRLNVMDCCMIRGR